MRYDDVSVSSLLPTPYSLLTIIVTHYRTPEILWECLRRLELYAKEAVKIVVDATSQDGTLDELIKRFPAVQGIEAVNHSYANLVNTGLKLANTPYIMQMNADVFIEEDTVQRMIEELQTKKVGMVSPRCKDKNGKWQQQGLLYRRHYAYLERTAAKSVAVSWVHGCCQMLRLEVLEQVGGMNSSYRFYNEDMEWSYRIRKAGYQCRLVRNSVTHLGGSATPKDPKFLIEGYRGGYVFSQQYKSQRFQKLHRTFVITEAGYKSRLSNDETKRHAYEMIEKMFRENRFEESPFGGTLGETNKDFLAKEKLPSKSLGVS